MALRSTRLINLLLSILFFITIIPESMFIEGKKQVPCLFFFGDSLTDNGNNNNLLSVGKVDYPPYGIDFPDGPTGRFSNGKNIPDFQAELLGFEEPIPPFATASGPEILTGVNYGSGGAGILDETGILQGARITFNQQLFYHEASVSKIEVLLGNLTAAQDHLNKCIYMVNMGSNEYANNYLLSPLYLTKYFFTAEKFADMVIKQYAQQLKTLYKYGARKIAVCGLAPLGCLPQYISNSSPNGTCVDSITKVVEPFNNKLKSLVDTLKRDLPDAHFVFINTTALVRGNDAEIGIQIESISCCITEFALGLCKKGQDPCRNRDKYAFFDNFHPSETLCRVIATRAHKATTPFDVYPFDIFRLAQI